MASSSFPETRNPRLNEVNTVSVSANPEKNFLGFTSRLIKEISEGAQCLLRWSRLSGSNRRPADYKSAALPTELSRQINRTLLRFLLLKRISHMCRSSGKCPREWGCSFSVRGRLTQSVKKGQDGIILPAIVFALIIARVSLSMDIGVYSQIASNGLIRY